MDNVNETVVYKRSVIVDMVRDLEGLVVSIDRIGSSESDVSKDEAYRMVYEFIDGWDVARKLANMRSILSAPFSYEAGEDGMDELERELQGVRFWSFERDFIENGQGKGP